MPPLLPTRKRRVGEGFIPPGSVSAEGSRPLPTDASPTSVVFYSLRIALFSASAISRSRGAAWAKNCRNAAQK